MKKKVLFVAYNAFNHGGIQSVIMSIVRNQSEDYCFDLLCFQEDVGELEQEFKSYGGKIIKLPGYYSGQNGLIKRLDYYIRCFSIFRCTRKAILEYGPYRVIHCNNASESGICLLAAKVENIPVRIAHSHTNFHHRKNPLRKIIDGIYIWLARECATHLIGCSREACVELYGEGAHAQIVPNAYDDKRFSQKQYLEPQFDSPQMIQVASYCNNKNQVFSIQIFSEIVKRYPHARLNMVGYENEPGYLMKMKEIVKECGLREKVLFLPSDSDLPFLLNNSSYFLFPSFAEGFGLALVEAQAMGLRCFVSDTVPRLSDCGGCVYLSLFAGPEVWADAIISDFIQSNGKHGSYDCSKYSVKCVTDIYKTIYQ